MNPSLTLCVLVISTHLYRNVKCQSTANVGTHELASNLQFSISPQYCDLKDITASLCLLTGRQIPRTGIATVWRYEGHKCHFLCYLFVYLC